MNGYLDVHGATIVNCKAMMGTGNGESNEDNRGTEIRPRDVDVPSSLCCLGPFFVCTI